MALKKIFRSGNGITTEYHMISALTITDRVEVKLKSYTNEGYRKMEKAIEDNRVLKAELEQQVLEESVKEEPDQELIHGLKEQIASLNVVSEDYSVSTFSYKMPFDKKTDGISYEEIYNKLKQEDTFADAEDC